MWNLLVDDGIQNIQCHHISYENRGREKLCDLMVICDKCHGRFHEFIDRAAKKPGRTRKYVMNRFRPFCIRRILKIHDTYRQHLGRS